MTPHAAFASQALASVPGEVRVILRDRGVHVDIEYIEVPPHARRRGLASAALRAITDVADEHGVNLSISPSDGFGSDLRRLCVLYARHGFSARPGVKLASEVVQMRRLARVPAEAC